MYKMILTRAVFYLFIVLPIILTGCQVCQSPKAVNDSEGWYSSPSLAVMTGYIYPPKSEFTI